MSPGEPDTREELVAEIVEAHKLLEALGAGGGPGTGRLARRIALWRVDVARGVSEDPPSAASILEALRALQRPAEACPNCGSSSHVWESSGLGASGCRRCSVRWRAGFRSHWWIAGERDDTP